MKFWINTLFVALGIIMALPMMGQEHKMANFEIHEKMGYIVSVPDDYASSGDKQFPLILFLHGSGERGDSLDLVKVHGPLKEIANGHKLPFVVVAPQCPAGRWWNTEVLYLLLQEVKQNYRIDTTRIYLTGLSMGGFGTWSMACDYPNEFAAIAPVCGGGNVSLAKFMLPQMPIWIFHGDADPVVPAAEARHMYEGLHPENNKVKLTNYPGVGHDSWTETYANNALYQWFLTHTK